MEEMIWIWLGVIVVACFFEFATAVQLISIWAALGALVALMTCLFNVPIPIQIIVFFVVTAVALILTRPLVKKLSHGAKVPTNADMCIGQIGKVISEIKGSEIRGQVRVSGTVWTATAEDEAVMIPIGTEVRIKRIDGVKLIVEPVNEEKSI